MPFKPPELIIQIFQFGMEEDVRLKVVFTGESSVGKTTLISWQVEKKFPALEGTIGIDFKKKVYQIGKTTAYAMLWDTSRRRKIQDHKKSALSEQLSFHLDSHAMCLCFCLNDRYSFERLPVWVKAFQLNQVECPLFLVGCKADLEHLVTAEEIKDYATKEGMTYFETSAKSNIGVTDNIQTIMETAYEYYQANPHVRMKPINRPVQQPGFCWS